MTPIDAHGNRPQPANGLRILLLEDSPADEQLCLRVLEKSFLNGRVDVARTRTEFIDRIHGGTYDVVLSDYALGTWTGMDAFRLLRAENSNVPFILVTGALGEEKAVECVKNGMADYILKDHLERLPLAISRTLDEKNLRDEHRRAELSLRESEEKFRTLAEAIPAAIFIEQENRCCYVNHAGEEITGYGREELLAMNFSQFIHPDSRDAVTEYQSKRLAGDLSVSRYEIRLLTKRKEDMRWLDVAAGTFLLGGQLAALITAFDITERKRAEREALNLRDPATGVASRQRLIEVFNSEAIRTDRTGRPFSVLFLALMGMKQIRIAYGQLVATRALCRLARIMQIHCRNLDTAARAGGDGFAFVLPETAADGALVLGNRIATRLSNDAEKPALSCVFGAGAYPQDGKTFDELFDGVGQRVQSLSVNGGAPTSKASPNISRR